jgi:predicted TIM-barrel fold metal-dependent hydrolase
VNIALTTVNSQLSLTDWLVSGALVRHPTIKVAFSEAQIGWMPFVHERVDTMWRKGHQLMGFDPVLREPPSSYARGRIFGCVFEDDFGLAVRDRIGVEQIMFETDYPHQDGTWPDSRAYAERAMAALGDEEVELVVRGNAIRVFELPVEIEGAARQHVGASHVER